MPCEAYVVVLKSHRRDAGLVRGPANIKGIMSMARRMVAVLGASIRFTAVMTRHVPGLH